MTNKKTNDTARDIALLQEKMERLEQIIETRHPADRDPSTLRVRRIEVLDNRGNPRIVIGCEDHPDNRFPQPEDRRTSSYGLQVLQSDGGIAHRIVACDEMSTIDMWADGDPAFSVSTFENRRPTMLQIPGGRNASSEEIDWRKLPIKETS